MVIKKEEKVNLNFMRTSKEVKIPEYALESDAGFDLISNENISFFPMEQKVVRTGIILEIPKGYVGIIRDRAGIVQKMNIHTLAGTFDSDFRGEISVMLVNMSEESVEIEKGMRIAQMILVPIVKAKFYEVKSLSKTSRGEKSFGSTGMKEVIKEIEKISKKNK